MSSTQDALRQLGLKAGFIYNIGVDRADPDDVAHIKVVNSAGALGVVILILYDSFYLVWDFANLWPLIAANLGFTVGYLTVIGLDGLGQNRAAQVLLFSVAFANITVATAFLGTESGIHLILIGMAALSLVSVRADNHAAKVLLIAISTVLFIVNHAFFAQGLAPDYPAAIMIVIYGISAASAISLVALPTLLYHYQLKQAETRVEAKERLLRAAMDNMTDGIYMLDENLDYLLVNRRYRDLVDLPGDPIREGGPVIDAIRAHAERGDYGPGEPDRIVADRLTALGDGSSGQKEMVIDDGERILDLRKAPIDGGGAVVVVSDVTKQRKALKDLNANKALLDGIFENCGSLVFVKDDRGHYLLVNKF